MLDALHRAAVFCDRRIGWNRIGLALSVTIIVIIRPYLQRIALAKPNARSSHTVPTPQSKKPSRKDRAFC